MAHLSSPGAHTLEEIRSQPRCWTECFRELEEKKQIERLRERLSLDADWLFVGCGSSYYAAQSAAASWTHLTGRRALAVPASDILLFPDLVLAGSRPCQPVLISRSGHTSEILKTAVFFETKKDIRTLAVSCATGQALEEIASATLYLLPADEQSTVMTRSFTSMLLGLQFLAASLSGRAPFLDSLRRLPGQAQPAIETLPSRIKQFVDSNDFADYVFLGQGPYYGLANESMLKTKEMSCSYGQCFHDLEFRHGPKAIVSRETLITFLMSETGYDAEREMLEEVKELGGVTLVVANEADQRTRQAADFLVELHLDVPEYARLAAFILTGQLLGFYTGLKKGFDPDRPRNLSRVVILNEKD